MAVAHGCDILEVSMTTCRFYFCYMFSGCIPVVAWRPRWCRESEGQVAKANQEAGGLEPKAPVPGVEDQMIE
jgi:hypothetical protein